MLRILQYQLTNTLIQNMRQGEAKIFNDLKVFISLAEEQCWVVVYFQRSCLKPFTKNLVDLKQKKFKEKKNLFKISDFFLTEPVREKTI